MILFKRRIKILRAVTNFILISCVRDKFCATGAPFTARDTVLFFRIKNISGLRRFGAVRYSLYRTFHMGAFLPTGRTDTGVFGYRPCHAGPANVRRQSPHASGQAV